MRFAVTLAVFAALAAPALAQTTTPRRAMRQPTAEPRETVIDKGPFTPEANRAYNGGGAILEGAPGGPPPPAAAIVPPPMR